MHKELSMLCWYGATVRQVRKIAHTNRIAEYAVQSSSFWFEMILTTGI